MGKEAEKNKFTWVIKNFSSLRSRKIYSDEFVVGGCIWRLLAFPKGNGVEYLSLYLEVVGDESLPNGWRRQATVSFTIVNQLSKQLSETKEAPIHSFDAKDFDWGFKLMFPLKKLHDKDSGFLVNGKVKIVAEVDVVEVIGELDVPDESEEAIKSLSQLEEDDGAESSDSLEEASSVKETMDVNGFQVLPSQVESVSRILQRHPDIASKFHSKNQHLKNSYMNVLLGLIETLCQSTHELSMHDLSDAGAAFEYLTSAGLNLDWLESKLSEVTEKKENEEELKDLKLKCSNLEAELEKEKADVPVARAPLSFDDIVA